MKLFISYSRQDKRWVYDLWQNLKDNTHHAPWIDKDLITGTDWWDTILTNIETCDCFVIVMSAHSLKSEYCVTECEYALALNKPILPLLLEDCLNAIPEEISQLRKIQQSILEDNVPIFKTLLFMEQSLSQIQIDINAGKYQPNIVDRPFVPGDVDDASLIYQGALDDIDHKNYQRAKRRLKSVIDGQDGVFNEMAKPIRDDFDFYIKRHEMYKSIKLLLAQEDKFKQAQQAWEHFIMNYGEDYDPDGLALQVNNYGYRVAFYRIQEIKITGRTTLDLSSIQMLEIPKHIVELSHLNKLILNNNQLSELPLELAGLKDLTYIKLNRNQLNHLPAYIGNWNKLKVLNASDNRLLDVPSTISRLPNLFHLQLNSNQLTSLPIEIGTLPKLETLAIYNNPLTDLPQDVVQQGDKAVLEWLRKQAREQGLV